MIAIRAARPEDAAAIAAIYAPYVAGGTVSFETDPPDTRAMRGRITASDGLYPWMVATSGESDIVLGYAYATKWRDRPAYRYIVETSSTWRATGSSRARAGCCTTRWSIR